MTVRVVDIRCNRGVINCQRPGPFGNPFATAAEFRVWFHSRARDAVAMRELARAVIPPIAMLGCCGRPSCHARVIAKYMNEYRAVRSLAELIRMNQLRIYAAYNGRSASPPRRAPGKFQHPIPGAFEYSILSQKRRAR